MEDLKLQTAPREVVGKKTSVLRRQGITPTHLFGHNLKSLTLQCDTDQLQHLIAQAGKTRLISLKVDTEKQARSVFVREVQRDAVTRQLLHVDFYQVKKSEKIAVDVPIIFVGEAPALKGKGRMLAHGINSMSVTCLPENVPPQIEVNLSPLEEVEQAIHVRDIVLNPEITVNTDPEQLVVKVSEALVKIEEEVPVEADVEEVEAEAEAPAEGKAPEQPPTES
ncbi:MAG: 50S ribosomal protein L25 [Dehalococcoidales bacterium]|jgi:large subunit ribosomal protein L25|nr:50S ribosomal protein L25 [Dehalococcoidales bacterium]MDP6576792.1 50S ribosomal protein L25 [Dehalococcoidales bacterium]